MLREAGHSQLLPIEVPRSLPFVETVLLAADHVSSAEDVVDAAIRRYALCHHLLALAPVAHFLKAIKEVAFMGSSIKRLNLSHGHGEQIRRHACVANFHARKFT